jgi:hypothetical protein
VANPSCGKEPMIRTIVLVGGHWRVSRVLYRAKLAVKHSLSAESRNNGITSNEIYPM